MNFKNKTIFTALLGLLSVGALCVGSAQAGARGDTSGYVTDSSGEIWRDRAGDCWHGSDWTPEDATVVGCDGVVLDAPVEVLIGEGTGVFADITIPAATMFAFDSAVLTDEGKAAIEEYRKTLRPELTNAFLVLVVGHTDTTGDEAYNQKLSLRRAESVSNYLVSTGVPADKLRVIGRGSKEPLVSNDTLEGRKQNRRVDIVAAAEVRALDSMMFPSVALFERRSGTLSPKGIALMDEKIAEARDMLSRASFVEVVGHTDDVGDDAYNMALSEERAKSVRDYLITKGLDPNKVVTTGKGESMPIASNSTPEGRAQNRRVQILTLGRLKE